MVSNKVPQKINEGVWLYLKGIEEGKNGLIIDLGVGVEKVVSEFQKRNK